MDYYLQASIIKQGLGRTTRQPRDHAKVLQHYSTTALVCYMTIVARRPTSTLLLRNLLDKRQLRATLPPSDFTTRQAVEKTPPEIRPHRGVKTRFSRAQLVQASG